MMRTMTRILTVATVAVFAAASAQASAVLSLNLSNNTSIPSGITSTSVTGSSDVVVVDIFVTVGPEGLGSVAYDLDTILGTPFGTAGVANTGSGNRAFTVAASTTNCPGSTACALSQLAAPSYAGSNIVNFNLATLGTGPIGGTYRIGTARFTFSGTDHIQFGNILGFDNTTPLGLPVAFTQNSFLVTVIPEPTTAALLGLGLFGLAVAGRRRA